MSVVLIPAEGNAPPDLDTSIIPEAIRQKIISSAYDAATKFFEQPGVREDFEQWRETRAVKKGA